MSLFVLLSPLSMFYPDMLSNFRGNGHPVQIVHRYHFASHLKRMAVVVRIQEEFFAFVKVCGLFICLDIYPLDTCLLPN